MKASKNTQANNRVIEVETLNNVLGDKGYKFLSSMNRAPKETHVRKLVNSFLIFGTAGVTIKVIKTKAFSGLTEFVTADGQHSLIGCIREGLPYKVQVLEMEHDTKENIRNYIAALNNIKKGWNNDDYLVSYNDSDSTDYKILSQLKKESGLTITDLLYIFLGGAGTQENHAFKNGEMNFINKEDSMELYNATLKVIKVIPKQVQVRRQLYKVMKIAKDYDRLANAILRSAKAMKEAQVKFVADESEFESHLIRIYQSEFKVKK